MPRKISPSTGNTPVRANHHPGDTRTNIPTAELESFARSDEKRPQIVRYPRDPSLDPQLVWKGKDEQDREDLAVPAVPVYIQETIDPLSLVEELRAESQGMQPEAQLDLFGPFTDLSFEEKVDFYRHPGKWTNRMILGDSLLVMASLAEKEGLKGQVQTIYIDPPYGIKFGSNWQVSTRKRTVTDGRPEDLTRQPEQVRAFRDTWDLGINSYLSYLRDRLAVARHLLTESGSVFVQIGQENLHLVRSVLDEVFGSENFVVVIPFRKKTMPLGSNFLEQMDDFLLWYSRDKERAKYRDLFADQSVEGDWHYQWTEAPDGTVERLTREQTMDHRLVKGTPRLYMLKSLEPSGPMASGMFDFTFEGKTYRAPKNGYGTTLDGMHRLAAAGRIGVDGFRLAYKLYADDFGVSPLTSPWHDTIGPRDKVYAVQTSTEVVRRCLLMTTDPGDLILDPTCGSGTTAYVAEQWGRRWITIDTSRVALALARSRLMAAKYPYYVLADSEAGIRKEAEVSGQLPSVPLPATGNDVRRGFVDERVPHVTLKSIAQNPEIHEGMSRAEVDAAIARTADTEVLFDRPYEDRKIVRVSGPFTVESLSPHRVMVDSPEDIAADAPVLAEDAGRFVTSILDNLKRAGVQNTKRAERLEFTRLDPYPGLFIQGLGEYVEAGTMKSVAIALGPEFGTVGPELIRDAAKEAVKVADLLVVCGFAPSIPAGEEASNLGRLQILQAKMNPDLSMGNELLKKTGTGNLFMVFGEPDIDVRPASEGTLVMEIKGLDVYDPTTGEIRTSSTGDIACWLLDTNYDGESFFVRHAYFIGADDPYEKLRRALRADISDEAWESINSTVSRPFPRPKTGKVAVKVINHYGDEVMRVYALPA